MYVHLFVVQRTDDGRRYAYDQREHVWMSYDAGGRLTCGGCGRPQCGLGWVHLGPRDTYQFRRPDLFLCAEDAFVVDATDAFDRRNAIHVEPTLDLDDNEEDDDDFNMDSDDLVDEWDDDDDDDLDDGGDPFNEERIYKGWRIE